LPPPTHKDPQCSRRIDRYQTGPPQDTDFLEGSPTRLPQKITT
jgi:hypothetical protein